MEVDHNTLQIVLWLQRMLELIENLVLWTSVGSNYALDTQPAKAYDLSTRLFAGFTAWKAMQEA